MKTLHRLACTALLLAAVGTARAAPPAVGEQAPDFEATTFDDKTVTLADFKGQVLVVNFWATWCEPCKKEMPLLDAYYRLQQAHGLRVVAVTTEDSIPVVNLKPLARLVSFPMLRKYKGRYAVLGGVPTNYIIDRAGVVRYAKSGAFDLDALNRLLIPLLREPAPELAQSAAPPSDGSSP